MNIKKDIDLELLSIKEIAILNALCNYDKNVVPEYGYTIPQVINKIKYIYKDIPELLNVKQNYVLNFMGKLLKYDYVVKTEISPKKIYFKFNDNGIELKNKAKKTLVRMFRSEIYPYRKKDCFISMHDTDNPSDDINILVTDDEIRVLNDKNESTSISKFDIRNIDISSLDFTDKVELLKIIFKSIEEDNKEINPSGEYEYR